jgi:hypothetical protein
MLDPGYPPLRSGFRGDNVVLDAGYPPLRSGFRGDRVVQLNIEPQVASPQTNELNLDR